MDSSLFPPDASDEPVEPIEEVGDSLDVLTRQYVNRWVFLPHQRKDALAELWRLIAAAMRPK